MWSHRLLAGATAPHPIVLDLTGVAFSRRQVLAELSAAHQRAADQGTPLRIVATGRVVLRPLAVTGMAATLDIRSDITAALAPPLDQTPDQPALRRDVPDRVSGPGARLTRVRRSHPADPSAALTSPQSFGASHEFCTLVGDSWFRKMLMAKWDSDIGLDHHR
jgi:anti-anti-sigma regulatory factor